MGKTGETDTPMLLFVCVRAKLLLCLTLCYPVGCSLPGSSVRVDSVGCHALLQGIFSTQGSSPGLLHCRWILYHRATMEAHVALWHLVNTVLWKRIWRFSSHLQICICRDVVIPSLAIYLTIMLVLLQMNKPAYSYSLQHHLTAKDWN